MEMTNYTHLIDLYDEGYSLFGSIVGCSDWINEKSIDDLDLDYFCCHSGNKPFSLMFERVAERSDTMTEAVNKIAKVLSFRFADKWNREYKALYADYNPIENYSMKEKSTTTPNLTDTSKTETSIAMETQSDSNVFAFNSEVPVDVNGSKGRTKTTGNADNNTTTDIHTGTTEYTHERTGNIGVTTSQQMIESEMLLRRKYDFYNSVYNDIDSILAFPLYLD